MATNTPNLGLTKPATTEAYNVGIQNTNMDKIDAAVDGLNKSVGSLISFRQGADIRATFDAAADGSMQVIYSYNVTTEGGWPATASNQNICMILRSAPSYGLLFARCGTKHYIGSITASTILWSQAM